MWLDAERSCLDARAQPSPILEWLLGLALQTHSGGTAPGLHRLPCYASRHPGDVSFKFLLRRLDIPRSSAGQGGARPPLGTRVALLKWPSQATSTPLPWLAEALLIARTCVILPLLLRISFTLREKPESQRKRIDSACLFLVCEWVTRRLVVSSELNRMQLRVGGFRRASWLLQRCGLSKRTDRSHPSSLGDFHDTQNTHSAAASHCFVGGNAVRRFAR